MAQKTNPTHRVKFWLSGTLFEYLLSALIAVPTLYALLALLGVLIGFRFEDISPTSAVLAWSVLSLGVFLLRDRFGRN